MKQENGKIFIDRDGETFQQVVNYLRNNKADLPKFVSMKERKSFFQELEFWHIETKHVFDAPQERYQRRYTNKGNGGFDDAASIQDTMSNYLEREQ